MNGTGLVCRPNSMQSRPIHVTPCTSPSPHAGSSHGTALCIDWPDSWHKLSCKATLSDLEAFPWAQKFGGKSTTTPLPPNVQTCGEAHEQMTWFHGSDLLQGLWVEHPFYKIWEITVLLNLFK